MREQITTPKKRPLIANRRIISMSLLTLAIVVSSSPAVAIPTGTNTAVAEILVNGVVTNEKGEALPGVNVIFSPGYIH